MIITISGEAGSGKGTLASLLAEELNYKKYSMGDMRGELAKKIGMTIDEFNSIGESADTDTKVDNYQRDVLSQMDNLVIDGRLSWYFIPDSFKVYLSIQDIVGATRIFNKPRDDERPYSSIDDCLKQLKIRQESDVRRYMKHYGVNHTDKAHYDLVLDTTNMTPQEELEQILHYIPKA